MRLAFVIDDYLPYSTRVGPKMLHELVLELVQRGHEAVVITPGAPDQTRQLVAQRIDGVEVLYFRSGPIKDVSKVQRALNETLLSWRAWRAVSGHVAARKIDGVVYYSPSIFFGPLVARIKQRWGCPSYLILRDIFPQWVIDEGMIGESSLIARFFRHFEALSYGAANCIGVMSQKNLEFFTQAFPRYRDVEVLYNWASPEPSLPPAPQDSLRQRLGLQDKVIYLYGGNIGHAQDTANLLRLAVAMREDRQAHFLFVGQGDEVGMLVAAIREQGLDNVSYVPSVPQEVFKQILRDVDVGLFTLARSHKTHNFPGKLLGYMVNQLPILGSVNPGNDLLQVINANGAGKVFVNGDDEALLQAARQLLADRAERARCGRNGLALLNRQFSVAAAADQVMAALAR